MSSKGEIIINNYLSDLNMCFEREKCTLCGACTQVCAAGALHLYGRAMTVTEVMETVESDRVFYEQSGGGMTLSGGEPTVQFDFALALLRQAKACGIHTALDTCGNVPWERFEKVLKMLEQTGFL